MQHRFQKGAYFTECPRCGVREHWGISHECPGVRVDRGEVSIAFSIYTMRADLLAFEAWWIGRSDLPSHLPSIEEWRAEFLSWSLKRSPVTPTTKEAT